MWTNMGPLLLVICLSFVLTKLQKYHQNDYTVQLERVEIVSYNQSYFRNISCGLVHYNRTFRAINCSMHLLKDLGRECMILSQMYKFLSNEYRFFPITIELNGCAELQRDTFGIIKSLQSSVNFQLRCPIKRGLLKMTYGVINFSDFPPFIPGGQYKDEIKFMDNSHHMVTVDVYAKVEEILKLWRNVTH